MYQLFIALVCLAVVLAVPFEAPLPTLQLRKNAIRRDGEHPAVAFQRHHNVGLKRMHLQSGLELPSDLLLEQRMILRRQAADEHVTNLVDAFPSTPDDQANLLQGELQTSGATSTDSLRKRQAVSTTARPATNTTARSAPGATTTITAPGSNAAGFGNARVDAIVSSKLTDSVVDPIPGGVKYIIESADIGYLAEMDLGTPPQKFLMLMDTGSADTWVGSTACDRAVCGQHKLLGPENSSTFRASNRTWEVTYGAGNVAGTLCADSMSIAGMGLLNHVFGVTTVESVQFSRPTVKFDGLVGLSFSDLSDQGVPTPLDSLKATGLIRNAILGIALGRVADGENVGELVFGGAHTAKLDPASTQTLPIISQGFLMVNMGGVAVNGVPTTPVIRRAILDTGTTLMIASAADAVAYHAQIPGSRPAGNGMFVIPCTTSAVVTLQFGGAAFQIDPRDLVFQPLTNDLQGECISSLSSAIVLDDQTWLLGDTFLKNVYMTANLDQRTVQLSRRVDVAGAQPAAAGSVAVEGQAGAVAQTAGQGGVVGGAVPAGSIAQAGNTTIGGVSAIAPVLPGVPPESAANAPPARTPSRSSAARQTGVSLAASCLSLLVTAMCIAATAL